jgi:hypothetical protein
MWRKFGPRWSGFPGDCTRTQRESTLLMPEGRVPMAHWTTRPEAVPPPVAFTKARPWGRESRRVVLRASSGPPLATLSTNTTVSPTKAAPGPDFVTPRLAVGGVTTLRSRPPTGSVRRPGKISPRPCPGSCQRPVPQGLAWTRSWVGAVVDVREADNQPPGARASRPERVPPPALVTWTVLGAGAGPSLSTSNSSVVGARAMMGWSRVISTCTGMESGEFFAPWPATRTVAE